MVIEIISKERLGAYLRASGHDEQRTLELYGWNIKISESFYPLLSASEVCLRNTISERIIELYGAQWWGDNNYLNQIRDGKRIVKTAKGKLRRKGRVTSGRMIAELNFGFWTKMLLPHHQAVFWADFNNSFDQLPNTVTYNQLYDRCESVCDLRNRIFHHEPIFNRDISKEYQEIIELIKWLSPEKADWIKGYSRVMTVLREKP